MAKKTTLRTEFRARRWLRLLVLGVCVLFVAGFSYSYRLQGLGWQSAAYAALSILGIAALAETFLVRVVLLEDAALLVTLRGRQRLPRESIASVKWEGGSGVALHMRDGSWVKLPEMGQNSQGLSNSIRAWLRRTEPFVPGESAHTESEDADG